MWNRKDLKQRATVAFKANYWVSVVAAIILSIFTAASSSSRRAADNNTSSTSGFSGVAQMAILLSAMTIVIIIAIVKIIVGNALIVGAQKAFVNNVTDKESVNFKTLVYIFSNGHWKNVAIVMFLKDLFTALWTLLFIIPGIVKSYEYRMIPYLLADNPEMDYKDAFAKSKEMMTGNKWNAFVLDLSFIWWFLLDAITLGIVGVFYIHPYYYQTCANLYLALKENA